MSQRKRRHLQLPDNREGFLHQCAQSANALAGLTINNKPIGGSHGFAIAIYQGSIGSIEEPLDAESELDILVERYHYQGPEYPYHDIAASKCLLSARFGLPTRTLQAVYSDVIPSGETSFFGSVVYRDVVVAVSGFKPDVDEALAKHVIQMAQAVARIRSTSDDGFFE